MRALVLGAALWGCTPPELDIYEQCDLDVVLEPTAAERAASVVATGGPYAQPYDTTVQVGGVATTVDAYQRWTRRRTEEDGETVETLVLSDEACDACDTCRLEAECTSCDHCHACEVDCADCVETLTFTVPDAAPAGPTSVIVLNGFGASRPVGFTVLGADLPTTASTAHTGRATGDTAGAAATGDTGP